MTRFRDAYPVRENYRGVEFESSKEGYWVLIKMRKTDKGIQQVLISEMEAIIIWPVVRENRYYIWRAYGSQKLL